MNGGLFFKAPERIIRKNMCDEEGGNGGQPQVQSDWAETDNTVPSFIKNKPNIGNLTETANNPTSTDTITFTYVGNAWDSLKRVFKAFVNIPALIAPGFNTLTIKNGKLFVPNIVGDDTNLVKTYEELTNSNTLKIKAILDPNDLVASGNNALSVVNNKLFVSQLSGGQTWYEYIIDCNSFFIQVEASKQTLEAEYDAQLAQIRIFTSDELKCKVRTMWISPTVKGNHDSSGSLRIVLQGNLVEHIVPSPVQFNKQYIKYPRQQVINIAADNVSENTPYLDDIGLVVCEKWYDGTDNTGLATLRFVGLDQLNQYGITLDF